MRRFLLAAATLVATTSLAIADDPPAAPSPRPASPSSGEKPKDDALVVRVPTWENPNCPIMGKPSSRALFVDTEKGRIYVCCPPCVAKIKEDPERAYKTAYPVSKKVANATCPVTGEKLAEDAPTVVLQGHEIRVCATCAARARANAQVVLAKVLVPGVVDVGNTVCPVTGQAVADNAYCLVGDSLVRLSTTKCVEDVRKDPKKALDAARASAEAARKASPPPGGAAPAK